MMGCKNPDCSKWFFEPEACERCEKHETIDEYCRQTAAVQKPPLYQENFFKNM